MPFQFRKEAIEEQLNTNFPSQGQGNPPLYYSLSEVVVPTYSINSVAEGSGLPSNLQTAWDFSTGAAQVQNTTTSVISNAGFWLVDLNFIGEFQAAPLVVLASVSINDGITSKPVWGVSTANTTATPSTLIQENQFVVFLRSNDTLDVFSAGTNQTVDIWYRQIADVYGNLVNPLGFSFA